MNKLIFILLFSFTQLSASATGIKLKVKQKGDTVFAKIYLGQINKEHKPYFISHINANISNKVVFDAYITPYVQILLRFSFIAKDNHDILTVTTIDNTNKKITKNRTIKKYNSSYYQTESKSSIKLINYRKENPSIWNKITIQKAIDELYGSKKIITETTKPQICSYYDTWLKLPIQTGQNTKSIAVFQGHRLKPTVAIFNTLINEENTFVLNISTERDDNMIGGKDEFIIIYEDINGSLHKVTQNFEVAGHHESCNKDSGIVTNLL